MHDGDWPAVQRIYRQGIATGHATFESEAPGWEQFNTSRLPRHRLVGETPEGRILGWAAVSPVSTRAVYSGVVEHSVYVAAEARGLGVGAKLLRALAESTEPAASGPFRPASSLKTRPASNSTSPTATSLSAAGNASPGWPTGRWPGSGATQS